MNKIKDEYLITNYSLVKLFDGNNINTITPSVKTQQGLVMYGDRDVFEKLFGGERSLALSLTENIGNFFLNFSKTIATAEAKETIKYYNHIKNDMRTIQNQTGGLDVKK